LWAHSCGPNKPLLDGNAQWRKLVNTIEPSAVQLKPFTRYNLLSNRLSMRLSILFENRLHRVYKHSTGCQTRLTTGLTTGCIVYTADCQTGCTTRFDNRLNENLFVQHGCQTRCQTGFDNRLNEQWLFVQHGCQTGCQTGLTTGWMFVYTIQPVVQPV